MGGLIVRPRARILHGHDWVYSTEVQKTYGSPVDGETVTLRDGRDRLLGTAIYNGRSKIVARRISHNRAELNGELIERRLARAWELRKLRRCDLRLCRAVWSESDGLPGLVLDRYGHIGVLQTLTLAMDRKKQEIAEIARRVLDLEAVIERNDSAIRAAEGLEPSSGVLAGSTDGRITMDIDGVNYSLRLFEGQKTGFYLDQRENHALAASLAKGRRVLDAFANQGGFALACAKAGAATVTAVESSSACVERLRHNALENGCAIEMVEADVFDYLPRAARAEKVFDLIILDPPSFAKGRGGVDGALRGYRELHRAAAGLLAPGGILASFSCSHHVRADDFLDSIRGGFHDARRRAHLLHTTGQPADHPVLLSMPETEYLKGFIVQVEHPVHTPQIQSNGP